MPDDIQALALRVSALEQKLLAGSFDPQLKSLLLLGIGVRYGTSAPTHTPDKETEVWVIYDGTDHWLYAWSGAAWHATKLDGTGFPSGLTQGDVLYVNSSGQIARLAAGTAGYVLQTQGAGADPVFAAVTPSTIEADFTYGETPAVGDLVGQVEALSGQDVLFQNFYATTNASAIGDIDTRNGYAMRFTMPYTLASSTLAVYLAKVGTPGYTIELAVYADTSNLPGAVIASTTFAAGNVTTSLAEYTLAVGATLTRGTKYWFGVKVTSFDVANYYTTYAQGSWSFYGTTAKYRQTSADWANNSNANALRFRLYGNTSAGVYKVLDVPNNLGIQGQTLGVVKSVNAGAGTCRVVTAGIYVGSGFTAGSFYYASPSTAGGLTATPGTTLVGYALSTTQLYVFPVKRQKLSFQGSPLCSTSTFAPVSAWDVMTGFLTRKATASVSGSSSDFYGDSDAGGIVGIDGGASSRAGFVSCADTTGFSAAFASTKYLGNFSSYAGGSSSNDITGQLIFEHT